MLLLSPLKTSELPEELPPLLEGCKPLLNQTEFVPDFDVPTNESYSSIIDQFSLPGMCSLYMSYRLLSFRVLFIIYNVILGSVK